MTVVLHWILDTVSPETGLGLPWFTLDAVLSGPHHLLGCSAHPCQDHRLAYAWDLEAVDSE